MYCNINKVFIVLILFCSCTTNEADESSIKITNLVGTWQMNEIYYDYLGRTIFAKRETNDKEMVLDNSQNGIIKYPTTQIINFKWYYQCLPDKFIRVVTQGTEPFKFSTASIYNVAVNSKNKHAWNYWAKNTSNGNIIFDSSYIEIELVRK